uniref:PBZ-type domain-containing protein n=1 Tax=Sphaeramia orbicularis TaxID=375764 RepID=A0A672ZC95_9TELE
MSRFDLVPVDGGEPIHLPLGDTVLGRGPLLGVSDKRVSRHHGLLENLNGQLRLKPTHLNPCFVQSSLSDDPRPLQKDTWFPLGDGDLFSLLPGQFIYRVVAVGGEEATPRYLIRPNNALHVHPPHKNQEMSLVHCLRITKVRWKRGLLSTSLNSYLLSVNATNVEKKPENTGETSQRVKPVGSNSSSVSGTASSKRLPCPYGKDCYRKNPIHFQECSHPGDPDYKEEEEDEEEEADRPECPYGTDCYRKNPLHKKEFKHTKRPGELTDFLHNHCINFSSCIEDGESDTV